MNTNSKIINVKNHKYYTIKYNCSKKYEDERILLLFFNCSDFDDENTFKYTKYAERVKNLVNNISKHTDNIEDFCDLLEQSSQVHLIMIFQNRESFNSFKNTISHFSI